MDAALRTYGETAARLRLVVARLFRQLKQSNPGELSLGQWSALAALEAGPVRNSDLSAIENVSAPTTTRMVNELEAAGLVVRKPDPQDGRSQLISLTSNGRAHLDWARGNAVVTLARRLSMLPPELVAQIQAVLPMLELLAESPGFDETASEWLAGEVDHSPGVHQHPGDVSEELTT